MANGIIARQRDAAALAISSEAPTAPVYIGQAPIWQVDSEDWAELAGEMAVITSIKGLREAFGFALPESGAIDKAFSLCGAAYYHANAEKVFPIIAIVNKSRITVSENATTVTVTFINNQASISGANVVLSTLELLVGETKKQKGKDFTATYDENGQNVLITALTAIETATASFKTVNPAGITFDKDTYGEIDYIPQKTGYIPTTIAAPWWDMETDTAGSKVASALAEKAEGVIDKHWFVQTAATLNSVDRATALAESESYSSAKMKLCWPYAKVGNYIYPVSLLFLAKKQRVDMDNDGIPYESASNEYVPITYLCNAAGTQIKQLELEADELNEKGIATLAFTTAMEWRTWGVCMANYTEDGRGSIAPNKLNDVAVQMMDYVCNDFERRYGDQVHKPMSLRAVNDILNDFGNVLSTLVSDGRLIAGKIAFEPSENSTANIADGQFTYSIEETNTPPAKAIIGYVTYDSGALDSFFEAE